MRPDWTLPLVAAGGRLLVAVCLLLALAPPPLPWARAGLDLVVLVDESRSMPREFVDQAWQQVRELLALAPAQTSVRVVRFAATPALDATPRPAAEMAATQTIPRTLALDPSATNIESALLAVLHGLAADRPAAVLLISDGAASHGDTAAALRAANNAAVPVYLLAPAAAAPAVPVRLVALQVPPRVAVGDLVPVRARVESAAGGAVEVLLETGAGLLLQRRQVLLAAGEEAGVTFAYTAQVPGMQLLRVRVQEHSATPAGKEQAPWLAQTRAVNVLGLAPVLYVSAQPERNPLLRTLRLAGWEVTGTTPGAFMAHRVQARRAGVIVLDDVATGDMSDSAWASLADAVRDQGTGLLVLGGGNSFGGGAYRHSRLEQLLPVTSEAPRPQPPAAVMFVLDRSGSMGREQGGPSALALARRAVTASLDMLLPGDQVGIITFAADVDTRLGLAPHSSAGGAVAAALDVSAAGGTRLAPALRAALAQLRQVEISRRLIILVTDGFAGEEDVTALAGQLQTAGITVIALAVGSDADPATLRELTGFNGGRLLTVTSSASLPRLLPAELAAERAPAQGSSTPTDQVLPIPFLPGATLQWPALSGYMVSRARPDSQLYLRSERGDPLLAAGLAGASRVVVLPAGLGQWAQAWWAWPQFGRFLGGLLLWVGQSDSYAGLSLRVDNQPGELVYAINTLPGTLAPGPRAGLLSVRGPTGTVTAVSPHMESPAHYTAVVPVNATGLYEATLHLGDRSVRQASYRNANNEFQPGTTTQVQVQTWRERGWLRTWSGARAFNGQWQREINGTRRPLLLLALLIFFTVLIWERGLVGQALRWVRSR